MAEFYVGDVFSPEADIYQFDQTADAYPWPLDPEQGTKVTMTDGKVTVNGQPGSGYWLYQPLTTPLDENQTGIRVSVTIPDNPAKGGPA